MIVISWIKILVCIGSFIFPVFADSNDAKAVHVGDLYGLVTTKIAGDTDLKTKCLKVTKGDKSVTIRALAQCPSEVCIDDKTIAMTDAAFSQISDTSNLSATVTWEWVSCPIPTDLAKAFFGSLLPKKKS